MHVLIVDDSGPTREALCAYLRGGGMECEGVPDAYAAVASLAARDYDAAVIDLCLPGMDGLALADELRATGKRLPLVILTAADDAALRQVQARQWDLAPLLALQKPTDPVALLALLRGLVEGGKAHE